MKRAVVDASVIGLFLLRQAEQEALNRLGDVLAELSFVQPAHWPLELVGLALRGARDQNLPASMRDGMRDHLASLVAAADVDDALPALDVFDSVLRFNVGVYDAPYLELAMRKRLPILTHDGGLAAAAARAGIELIALP